jgi:branched-chain amino acid transport system permease protein
MATQVGDMRAEMTDRSNPVASALGYVSRNLLTILGLIVLAWLIWRGVSTIAAGEYTLETFVRQLIFGLAQGSIYALIALGYTLVYGILRMINFAHSEVFMAGTYIGFFFIDAMDRSGFLAENTAISLLIVFAAAIAASVLVAVGLERIAYRPLRNAPRLIPLITAIGASTFLQRAFQGLFGSSPRVYPDVHFYIFPQIFNTLECGVAEGVEVCRGLDLISGRYTVNVFGIELVFRPIYFLVFITAIVMMVALTQFVKRTKTGKAMRATSFNRRAAALMGINVDRMVLLSFALSGALGAVAGIIIVPITTLSYSIGVMLGLKGFAAAVLGGYGNSVGAVLGGLTLGILESLGAGMISSTYKDVIAFAVLLIVLFMKPSGLLGYGEKERA